MMTMKKQDEYFGEKVVQAQVFSIGKTGGYFMIKTQKAVYESTCLFIATSDFHRNLEVSGEKELYRVVVFLIAQLAMPHSLEIKKL